MGCGASLQPSSREYAVGEGDERGSGGEGGASAGAGSGRGGSVEGPDVYDRGKVLIPTILRSSVSRGCSAGAGAAAPAQQARTTTSRLLSLPIEMYSSVLSFLSISGLGRQDCLCRHHNDFNIHGTDQAWRQRCSETLQLQSPVGFRKVGDIIVSNRTHVLLWKDLYHLRIMQPCANWLQFKTSPCDHFVIPVVQRQQQKTSDSSISESLHGQICKSPPNSSSTALRNGAQSLSRPGRRIRRKNRAQRTHKPGVRDHRLRSEYAALDLLFMLPCVLFLLAGCCSVAYGSVNYPESNEYLQYDAHGISIRGQNAVGVSMSIQDPITGSILTTTTSSDDNSMLESTNLEHRKLVQKLYTQSSETTVSGIRSAGGASVTQESAAADAAVSTAATSATIVPRTRPSTSEVQEVDDAMNARFGGPSTHQCDESTYGELLHSSLQSLVGPHFLNLSASDRFLDLGSGRGATILQAALAVPGLSLSAGIELSSKRHLTACKAVGNFVNMSYQKANQTKNRTFNLKDSLTAAAHSVVAVHADMFSVDWSPFTVVYVSALCFRPEMMRAIAKRLIKSHQMGNHQKPIKVLSLRKLPIPFGGNVRLVQTTKTLATWGWTNAYIYRIGHEQGSLKHGVMRSARADEVPASNDNEDILLKWRSGLQDKCDYATPLLTADSDRSEQNEHIGDDETQSQASKLADPPDNASETALSTTDEPHPLVKYYDMAIARNPQDTHALLRRGQLRQMVGDHANAIKDFRVVYKLYSGSISWSSSSSADHRPQSIVDDETECAMEGLAYSFLEMGGHFQQAERWYRRLIYGMHNEKKPSHKKKSLLSLRHSNSAQAGWHTNLGNALFAQGKIDEAVLHFKMSTRIDKSRPFAYDGLGRASLKKGRSKDIRTAIKYFQRAVALSPENALFRQSLGAAFFRNGQLEAAASEYASAIKLNDGLAAAYRGLGYCLTLIGRIEDRLAAIGLFQKALEIAPHDSESQHYLKVLSKSSGNTETALVGAPASVPRIEINNNYARSLFDGMAPHFEATLVENLRYRGPEIIMKALHDTQITHENNLGRVADLGCGTGLQGPLLKSAGATFIYGVDISHEMLRVAKTKGCYDELSKDDLLSALERQQKHSFDLIIAGDTFPYVADLTPVINLAASRLKVDGRVAFSLERLEDCTTPKEYRAYELQLTGRVAHCASHVLSVAHAAGLTVALHQNTSTRRENDRPVKGMIFVLIKDGVD